MYSAVFVRIISFDFAFFSPVLGDQHLLRAYDISVFNERHTFEREHK